MKKYFIVILVLLSFDLFSIDHHKVDSLLNVLKTSKQDTCKVLAYVSLCSEYRSNSPEKALQYGEQGLVLAKNNNYLKGQAQCYYSIGLVHQEQGNYNKSVELTEMSLKIRESLNDKSGMSKCYVSLGNISLLRGLYDKAIEYYLKSAKIAEQLGDKKVMAANYHNIGIVCKEQGNYDKVLTYFTKAMEIRKEIGFKKGLADSYNAMSIFYLEKNNYEKAIQFSFDAIKLNNELENKKGLVSNYINLGIIYDKQNKIDLAQEYFHKAITICFETGDKNYLSIAYPNLASVLIKSKRYAEASQFAQKGMDISLEIGALDNLRMAYSQLFAANDSLGNTKLALKYHKLLLQVKDSMYSEAKHKQLSQLEAVYESEKKQKEIALLEKDKVLQKSEIKRQTTQKYALLGGLCLMLVLASVVLYGYRKIRAQKYVIEDKNLVLGQQNTEIAAQRDLVTSQKNHIEEIHHELTDSIQYAKRIQSAVLPSTEYVSEILNVNNHIDYFILFKPRDIVSGDFYFLEKRNNWILIAVADCTGHGVPGAFMSMLGITFLQEIIAKTEVQSAAHVLDELREYVIKSLQQKGMTGEQKDGMDITFIALDTETNIIQFAGANNPLWIVEACHDMSNPSSIIEIKPDKMPVAIYENMKPFTNHIIQLNKGDIFYLASDGYEDQFGGSKGKKFMTKQLRQLLADNCSKTLNEQKNILDTTIENWKNFDNMNYEQTDDISILGIKIL